MFFSRLLSLLTLLMFTTDLFSQEAGDIVRQENQRDSQAHSSPNFKNISNLVAYVHPESMAQVLEVKKLPNGLALKVQFLNPKQSLLVSPKRINYQGDIWVFNSFKRPLYRVIVKKENIEDNKESYLKEMPPSRLRANPRREVPVHILKSDSRPSLTVRPLISFNFSNIYPTTSKSQTPSYEYTKLSASSFSFPQSFKSESRQNFIFPKNFNLKLKEKIDFSTTTEVANLNTDTQELEAQKELKERFDTLDIAEMNLEDLQITMNGIVEEIFTLANIHPDSLYDISLYGSRKALSQMRHDLFEAMYRLSFQKREMAIAVFTAWGESRSGIRSIYDTKGRAEMIAVIHTLYARVLDKQTSFPRPDEILDVALQPSQFSMYSLRDPNWPKAFLGPAYLNIEEAPSFDVALLAFRDFKKGVTIYGLDNVTHYCRPSARAAWRRPHRRVLRPEILIENAYGHVESKTVTRHVFYTNTPWDYYDNEWKLSNLRKNSHNR